MRSVAMMEIVASVKEALAEGKICNGVSGSGLRGAKVVFSILCQLYPDKL